jgi:hypothetical protein
LFTIFVINSVILSIYDHFVISQKIDPENAVTAPARGHVNGELAGPTLNGEGEEEDSLNLDACARRSSRRAGAPDLLGFVVVGGPPEVLLRKDCDVGASVHQRRNRNVPDVHLLKRSLAVLRLKHR